LDAEHEVQSPPEQPVVLGFCQRKLRDNESGGQLMQETSEDWTARFTEATLMTFDKDLNEKNVEAIGLIA
jgi:hypothetical protein